MINMLRYFESVSTQNYFDSTHRYYDFTFTSPISIQFHIIAAGCVKAKSNRAKFEISVMPTDLKHKNNIVKEEE